jgi:hypothetical protein
MRPVLSGFMSCAGTASPTGSARVSVPKVVIGQDSIFAEVEVALQDEPAWQVCLTGACCHCMLLAARSVCMAQAGDASAAGNLEPWECMSSPSSATPVRSFCCNIVCCCFDMICELSVELGCCCGAVW